ncbi:FtsW/RodA/SpoVE family cell cycle protein [Clostridium uliginosum]|uniref:Cell division protein FtsW, lipid II flippase n=1 Tax=Clostridium uliginosum TaxID=119641 RepID=A0A1I1I7D1_9CLOT|nr:FtsW/RodA/SpoVE family cell cycle protein [Clostridium uliginosum]SFC32066.1 cell division protein FtsW, lipid II flippase [Clostridium uliginosum]
MSIKNNDEINNYINDVCLQVKNRRVHKEIKNELVAHLEEKTNEYIRLGEHEDEALKKAINQMGSSKQVGSELNTVHRSNPEWSVIVLSVVLALFSIVIMSFFQWNGYFEKFSGYISKRNNIFNILGILCLVGACFIDYRKIKKYSKYIYIVGLLGISITVFGDSPIANGVKQWIQIGTITINMGYVAPMLIIVALSGIYDNYNWNSKMKIITGVLLGIVPIILIVKTNSLCSILIYAISLCLLVYLSKAGKKILSLFIGIQTLIMILTGRGFQSILNYIDINGNEYIYNQLKIIRDSSVLIGKATNFEKNIIPDFYADYILSYIIYNFGWIAGIIVITIIGALLIRIIKVALCVKNSYGKSLVLGVVAIISFQFIWNVLLNFGITIIGAPLPFISYGGTSMIVNMLIVGIIINVYKGRSISKVELE